MRISRRAALYSQARFDPDAHIRYTGSMTVIDDGSGRWRVKFLTSGTVTFTKDPDALDLFLVGGGGSGGQSGGGGGGGYTALHSALSVAVNTGYPIVIGAGGAQVEAGSGNDGSPSSAFGHSAAGGKGGIRSLIYEERYGGDGGSGGGSWPDGAGGADGANGQAGSQYTTRGGLGQGTTTREFHEAGGAPYAAGGASGTDHAGALNTGDGGDGYAPVSGYYGLAGGSGIVVIRNAG